MLFNEYFLFCAKKENGLDSGTLQQVEVPVLSNRNCRATGYGESRIMDNMLCAGYAEGGRDSCQVINCLLCVCVAEGLA